MSNDPRVNRIDYIEFPVATAEALADARRFYGEAFGWQYKSWGETYADTQSSGVASGISADAGDKQHRLLVVIYSDNLENTRAGVLAASGSITKDIFAFPGGRRFHFQDPTGNELAVWSDT